MDFNFFTDIAKRYGLPFLLLCLAIWWLNTRLNHIETRLQDCEAEKFQIITQNNERSNAVIAQNTIALERNTDVMESIQAYLDLGVPVHQKKRLVPLTARQGINK